MCLDNIQLKLSKNKSGEWVGTGYKYIKHNQLDKSGRLNYTALKKGWSRQWITAYNESLYCDVVYDNYTSGFHIFLDPQHVLSYPSVWDGKIMEVQFKDVIGFGHNTLFGTDPRQSVPCVIANQMRVIKLHEH